MFKKALEWTGKRLSEKSTWVGIAKIAAASALPLPPVVSAVLLVLGGGAVALPTKH